MSNEKKNIFKPFQTVLRGLTEVATVVFTNKKVKTNFEKQETDDVGENTEPPSDDTPLSKLSDDDELEISDEQLRLMGDFFEHHTTMDAKSFMCRFNGAPCEAIMCVFPRIIKNEDGIPVVNDVISMLITDGNDILAISEYKSGKNVQKEFYEDMQRVRHKEPVTGYRTSFQTLAHELEQAIHNTQTKPMSAEDKHTLHTLESIEKGG